MRRSIPSVTAFVLVALLVAMFDCVAVMAQNQEDEALKRVLMPTGWKIPGLSESRETGPRHPLPAGYGVQGVSLQITLLKPTREVRETIFLYATKDQGETLIVGQRHAAVRAIIKCDIKENVFLYIVQFGNLGYDPKSKMVSQSGLFGLFYYDNDGDGIFESRESGSIAVTPDLRIPDWALKNAGDETPSPRLR